MNIIEPVKSLKERVAEAMWNEGECPMPWDQLDRKGMDRKLVKEFHKMAESAIRVIQAEPK